jgi:uncharacterized protein
MTQNLPNSPRSSADAAAVLAAMVYPAAFTWLYFVALQGKPSLVQQSIYVAGKTIQFAFPALWVAVMLRGRPRWQRPSGSGVTGGLAFGAAVSAAMLLGYFAWLKPAGLLDALGDKIADKVTGFGVSGPAGFVALGAFYAVGHSFLEEYYWRWFVFGRLRPWLPPGWAVVVASLAFTAHHVIVLSVYFGWSPMTAMFSIAVAIGGAAWCWMYHRSGSLTGIWLSHMLVDAAIFVVGYDLASHAVQW